MKKYTIFKYLVFLPLSLLSNNIVLAQQKQVATDTVSLYLSFDDGPMEASKHIISFLHSDSIPITVFLVGCHALASAETKNILQAYRNNPLVEIDNHSYCHANKKYKKFYKTPDKVVRDMVVNEDTLQLHYKIARLPGRNVWRVNGKTRNDLNDAKAAADSLQKMGYIIFGWDIEWCFDSTRQSFSSAEKMISTIKGMIEKNKTFAHRQVIILCHDPMLNDEYARNELKKFINEVRQIPGWSFRHLRYYPADRLPHN